MANEKRITLDREAAHARLDTWLDQVESAAPNYEYAEEMAITFSGCEHYYEPGDDDTTRGHLRVETKRTEDGV